METGGNRVRRMPRQQEHPANRGPDVSHHRQNGRNRPFSLLRADVEQGEVFRPLPREVVRAFLNQPRPTAPRFVILLPVEAGLLWEAINLAVVLGQSLGHMPELRARDELVLDVEAGTYHHAFCDLLSPAAIECARPCGHDGPCAEL